MFKTNLLISVLVTLLIISVALLFSAENELKEKNILIRKIKIAGDRYQSKIDYKLYQKDIIIRSLKKELGLPIEDLIIPPLSFCQLLTP